MGWYWLVWVGEGWYEFGVGWYGLVWVFTGWYWSVVVDMGLVVHLLLLQ